MRLHGGSKPTQAEGLFTKPDDTPYLSNAATYASPHEHALLGCRSIAMPVGAWASLANLALRVAAVNIGGPVFIASSLVTLALLI